VGTLVWPTSAATAVFDVKGAAGWVRLPESLIIGRRPIGVAAGEIAKAAADLEARHEQTRFRSEGADVLQTILVP
jgi:hypothetical protein